MKTKFITSILLLTLLWPTHSTYALENDCLRPVAAGEKKGPSDGGTPLVTWVGTPHPLIKEVIDGILNSEALDIKNLQQRIVQKGIKVYLVVLGPLPRGVKFRTILVDEELRKEIIKMVGHEIPHGRSYLLCVSSEVIYGLPTLRQWKIKHELYHMIYPPLELELQFQLVREARNINNELLSSSMQGIIGSLDDMDLLRRMLKGGDEEDAIMEAEGRLADLRHRIIEYQNAPAPEWLKKTQDYARMVIEGFGSEYLMEVMPFRLEDRIDIADRLEKELNEIFRAAGIKEEYIKAGKRFAENVLKNTPSKSIYPSFTVLVDIARRLEGEVSNLIIAQFASLLAEMFSNTSDDAALTQI